LICAANGYPEEAFSIVSHRKIKYYSNCRLISSFGSHGYIICHLINLIVGIKCAH
jgi:hypothetical protein